MSLGSKYTEIYLWNFSRAAQRLDNISPGPLYVYYMLIRAKKIVGEVMVYLCPISVLLVGI